MDQHIHCIAFDLASPASEDAPPTHEVEDALVRLIVGFMKEAAPA